MRILFDVGSCNGDHWSDRGVNASPDTQIYAFEPDPMLYQKIYEKNARHNPNYHLFNYAISDYEGTAQFNCCIDNGCSSLHPMDPDRDVKWQVDNPIWKYKRVPGDSVYRSFRVSDVVETKVVRMDNFCAEHNIQQIDFLHIDAEGSDLAVLKGFGEKYSIIQAGEMEIAWLPETALFQNQHTLDESIRWLLLHDFMIESVLPIDEFMKNGDIHFKKSPYPLKVIP